MRAEDGEGVEALDDARAGVLVDDVADVAMEDLEEAAPPRVGAEAVGMEDGDAALDGDGEVRLPREEADVVDRWQRRQPPVCRSLLPALGSGDGVEGSLVVADGPVLFVVVVRVHRLGEVVVLLLVCGPPLVAPRRPPPEVDVLSDPVVGEGPAGVPVGDEDGAPLEGEALLGPKEGAAGGVPGAPREAAVPFVPGLGQGVFHESDEARFRQPFEVAAKARVRAEDRIVVDEERDLKGRPLQVLHPLDARQHFLLLRRRQRRRHRGG
mmetsp:Transcript_14758/g.48218  ORF Transcript_14758/g.48218 Transcript_14758/m.48218 type:complete len:267 (-) Transcript_14758:25-825(-)